MKIHHLNCATLRPPGVPEMVTHCLLVETESGPVLVDAGYGADDIDRPRERMGSLLPRLLRPALEGSETAIEQVRGLGFAPEDVKHVILTHLDVDHVGGVSDFPWARVHLTRDELRLYTLIWKRFVASQMAPAILDQTSVDIAAGPADGEKPYLFRATGSVIKFAGFLKVYEESREEDEKTEDEGKGVRLPPLVRGEVLDLVRLLPKQHFTKPPPRYSDASLIRALEE